METFPENFGNLEVTVKELFEKYNSISNSPRKKRLGRIISAIKKKYVEIGNYVGILNISRYLDDYEKDRLFYSLLEQHPTSSLFVLAFADSEMHSYEHAYKMKTSGHNNDEEALRKDVQSTFNAVLCSFIREHNTKDDLDYFRALTDGAKWLDVYKEPTLSQL